MEMLKSIKKCMKTNACTELDRAGLELVVVLDWAGLSVAGVLCVAEHETLLKCKMNLLFMLLKHACIHT